jgi:DNA-directed RNA polymerase specialized sigma subunit
MEDLSKILKSMSNERFRRIIQLHYVEEKSNKETAAILGISMENYYNKHLLAKKQFCQALREEGLL